MSPERGRQKTHRRACRRRTPDGRLSQYRLRHMDTQEHGPGSTPNFLPGSAVRGDTRLRNWGLTWVNGLGREGLCVYASRPFFRSCLARVEGGDGPALASMCLVDGVRSGAVAWCAPECRHVGRGRGCGRVRPRCEQPHRWALSRSAWSGFVANDQLHVIGVEANSLDPQVVLHHLVGPWRDRDSLDEGSRRACARRRCSAGRPV